jgi:hypothetical protein
MSEANKIDLEDYVQESEYEDNNSQETKEDAFNAFEQWAEAVEQGKLADDQIVAMKQALEQLPQGDTGPELDLEQAYNFFNEFGIDDNDLENAFQDESSRDPEIQATSMQIFQSWAKENYPELLTALGMSGTEAPAAEPPAAPPEAPAPDAAAAPAAPEQPTAENQDNRGMEPVMSREGVIKEVAKIVKSFYNADNPEVGPFRGGEGIALDCKKQVAEKFGDEAGEFAEAMAGKFIDKLTQEWTQKHGRVASGHGDDGLARLKELLGNVKQKVESMGGDTGVPPSNIMAGEEKDNWHPSKHVTDPQKKKELAPHNKDVQRGSYKDRADYLTKGNVPKSENTEMENILRLANYKK